MEDPSSSQQVVYEEVSPKKCCGRHKVVPTLPRGQEGTALSYKSPVSCHLNSLFIHLQVAQHSHSLLPNPKLCHHCKRG